MSIRLMSAVWEHSSRRGAELLLLLALADHANDEGVCWPSVRTLARKCRLTERHTKRLIRNLIDSDEIEVEDRPGHSSRYYIMALPVEGHPGHKKKLSTGVTPESPQE